ncbi:hypothetical protein COL154_012809 [Colletotrichum chrysophilum]|uniref:DUF6604 domain-containing protein n=1 Tax=Colletotrichum chrysophilum TaxID=1836956 RepID=A0AAD9EEZ1_9PEZI|nr:uncharacterized protein COL26b_012232 [Colletotrichum chrysophilum]KAJ0341336.1 hypothetical protein KNSL1_011161 [Colletotrichum chrysophilum]KAJ0351689.1 hypothetical protein COL154_012809 [Colletotrichum chrysophilum]KAJ0365021.1 hypothetical protein COL26b_012232 [Colletotrichum chrysophilum]KAK1848819.1 hypothetical protein CCHR01_08584 [Colletotrichum chrysophilum]
MAPTLDSSVSELCRDYKSSTNFFMQWLLCQARLENPATKKFTTTGDILAAARVVKEARSVVPKSILSSLRTAITKRKQVYNIYQKNGAGDPGHAVFCQRLESTLDILSSLTTASAISSSSSHVDESENNVTTANAFAPLAATVEDIEDDASETGIDEHMCHSESENETAPASAPPAPDADESDFVLEDDAIRLFYEAANFLLELGNVYSQVEGYWHDAANDKLPLPVAAWLTSLAAHAISKDMPRCFINLCESVSTKCKTCPDCPGIKVIIVNMSPSAEAAANNIACATRIYTLAKAMNEYGSELPDINTLMMMFVSSDPSTGHVRTGRRDTKAKDREQDQDPRLPQEDETHLREILDLLKADFMGTRGIAQLEQLKQYRNETRVTHSEPLFDFALPLFREMKHTAPGNLVIAMDLFMLAASVTQGRLSPAKCRLRPVRLALEMRSAVDPVLEFLKSMNNFADWSQAADYLENFRDGLTALASERAFDKYHGSAWTVGNHLTELLTQASVHGANLCWDWAIVNSTLHLYNAMRRVDILRVKKIPLLDELADILAQDTFRGARPDRNFASTFRRTVFNCGINKTQARVQYGFTSKPLRGQHIMWLLNQHRQSHSEGLDWLGEVHGVVPCKKQRCWKCRPDRKKDRNIRDTHRERTLAEYMERAKGKVIPELEGKAPISRLNFFGIFMYCANFMKTFGQLSEDELGQGFRAMGLPRYVWGHPLHLSRLATEVVLESVDQKVGSREGRRLLKQDKLVNNAGQAFKELDTAATLSQFVWTV